MPERGRGLIRDIPPKPCVFCQIAAGGEEERPLIQRDEAWVAFHPIGPVNEGHTLIVPGRHIERMDQMNMVESVRLPTFMSSLRLRLGAVEFNIGVNSGAAAGQTVPHLHIHYIPRQEGDVEDPRGGIVAPLGRLFKESQFDDYLQGRLT